MVVLRRLILWKKWIKIQKQEIELKNRLQHKENSLKITSKI
jgi:hypothetical protein